MRRRAEARCCQERTRRSARWRAYFATTRPLTAKGRFALARALIAAGRPPARKRLVRDAWRNDSFSADLEAQARAAFGELITHADHKARMDRRLYAEDAEAGMRAAQRLGGNELAIAKARIAYADKSGNAKALLDAVPAAAQHDAGYMFSRIQWLRRADKIAEAAALMQRAARPLRQSHDLDEWWIERRLLARKLLDLGDAKAAYEVARDAAPPNKDNYRAEHQFTAAGSRCASCTTRRRPRSILRASASAASIRPRWRAPAIGRAAPPRRWDGTRRRARITRRRRAIRPPITARSPAPGSASARSRSTRRPRSAEQRAGERVEVVRAAEILYAVDERDDLVPLMADLGDKSNDSGALAVLAELTAKTQRRARHAAARQGRAGARLSVRPLRLPDRRTAATTRRSAPGRAGVVYSIARQESAFNPGAVSSANALGLMQVTPAAGKYIAKKFNVTFDQKRLLNDTVYNVQMGAAELGGLIEDYRGSYIMTFAAYNAGRGSVKKWVERYGDPRDPKVDAVDWVERIPFSETRNYVQRIMENLQVYRARFGGGTRLQIEADLRRAELGLHPDWRAARQSPRTRAGRNELGNSEMLAQFRQPP